MINSLENKNTVYKMRRQQSMEHSVNFLSSSFNSYIPDGFHISIVLIVLLLSCSAPPDLDKAELYIRDISEGIHNTIPVRGTPQLAFFMGEDAFSCSICHDGFTGGLQEQALEGQHAHIEFDHGLNVSCLNCHNRYDSDAYAYHDESIIPADEPNRLCAKCHGPQYRNWNLGIHGRRGPYWNELFGPVIKLDCIQCHDPHKPKFQLMKPEPAPVLTRFEVTRPVSGQTMLKELDSHD